MPPRKKQRTDGNNALPVVAAPRRTTRASAKSAQADGPAAEGPAIAAKPTPKTKAKMAKPDALKRVVNKGRLQTLPDLAVEVQLEIYNLLELEDIYNLSRTCKKFRGFFTDKDADMKLWVPARMNTPGIPARPPWMGERAFAYLLYSPHCHNCGAPNIRKIVYGWFVRLCSACLQKRTIWYGYAAMDTQDIEDGSILRNMFYHNTITSHFHVEGYSHLTRDQKLNRLFVDDVNRVFEQFEALPDSADKKTFPDQVKAEHRARLPYANAIHQWMHQREEQRLDRLDDVRQQRFDAILAKLRDAGWGKDLDFMGEQGLDTMYKMPVVRQSSKLTEGGWQKVLIVLDDLLKSTREKRLNSEYRQTIWARFITLEKAVQAHYVTLPRNVRMDCRPQYIDLALARECRAIIDVPMSETVTIEDLAAAVPALVQAWEADIRKALTELLLPHLGDVAADVDPLELAVSFFHINKVSCPAPISIMRYPAILKHRCNQPKDCYRSGWYTKEDFLKEDLYTRTTKTLGIYAVDSEFDILGLRENVRTRVPFHMGTWGTGGVVARMRRVVSAMGLDPARATFEELERCDVWLRCTTCETEKPNNPIFARSWNRAYEHELHHCDSLYPSARDKWIPEWRHADEEDMLKIQAAKESMLSKTGGHYRCSCALCPDFDSTADAMVKHLATTHEISDFSQARRDGVVYLHPHTDRSMAFADAVCLRERSKPKAP